MTLRATTLRNRHSFNIGEVAMQLYSSIEEFTGNEPMGKLAEPVRTWRANAGAAEARAVAWQLAPKCDKVWKAIPKDQRDGYTWDYAFIDDFLIFCVDWSSSIGLTTLADPKALAARLMAAKGGRYA